jgi:hypothetical protein
MFQLILILCVTALLLILGARQFNVGRRGTLFDDRKVAGPVRISAEWSEVIVEGALRPEGDDEEVGLYFSNASFQPSPAPPGLKLPDGSTLLPEVEIADSKGVWHTLKYSGARGEHLIRYRVEKQPDEREYRALRVRADGEVQCTSIYWTIIRWKYMH